MCGCVCSRARMRVSVYGVSKCLRSEGRGEGGEERARETKREKGKRDVCLRVCVCVCVLARAMCASAALCTIPFPPFLSPLVPSFCLPSHLLPSPPFPLLSFCRL